MTEAFAAVAAPPLIDGNKALGRVTRDVCAPMSRRPGVLWWAAFLTAGAAFLLGAAAETYQLMTGVGTWGLNTTVGWAFDITNFVFWIGIGHAGTLISAILFLLRQRWRTSVNRAAEAMTLFAVMCAGLFPLIHMGRPWLAYWVLPYPNTRGSLWINFRSPLAWDAFAISTYFIISATFYDSLGQAMPDLDVASSSVQAAVQPLNPAEPEMGPAVAGASVEASTGSFHLAMLATAGLLLAGALTNAFGLRRDTGRPEPGGTATTGGTEPPPAAAG